MSRPAFDVLGLGVVAIDDLLLVESYPPPDAKTPVRHRDRQCGGLTATALVAASRLGSRCAFAGVLGDDELSRFAIERMQEEGVDLAYLLNRPGAKPGHSTIIVARDRRTRNVFYDGEGVVGADPDWPPEEVIRSTRVLFVDHVGIEGQIRAARIAREAGIPVVADFEDAASPLFPELLALTDHLIIPAALAESLTDMPDVARAAIMLQAQERAAVVITCGEEGAWRLGVGDCARPVHEPAFEVAVVDTTGCGDVFHGAYASALARGLELPQSVRFASAAAALKATKPGGQAGIPDRATVEAFLKTQGRDLGS